MDAEAKKRKRRRQLEKLGLYQPPDVSFAQCLKLTVWFAAIGGFIWLVYSNVRVQMIDDRVQYYRWCIDANEQRIQPSRDLTDLIDPEPVSFGSFSIDYKQREVRWWLADALGSSVVLAGINLRGPLRSVSHFVAPVVIGMGASKDPGEEHFSGVLDIDSKLAVDVIERPYAYYISFENATGVEVARDKLTKQCNNNL